MEQFAQLKKLCEENADKLKETNKFRQHLKEQNVVLHQRLMVVEEKLAALKKNQQEASQQLNKVNFRLSEHQNLSQCYNFLGYRLTQIENSDLYVQVVTLHFNEEYFIKLKIGEIIEVLQIYPPHPNMDAINDMLLTTKDVFGLLWNLQKYFNIKLKANK